MLASISPLGERARGNRWWLTAGAFAAGAVAAATLLGAGLGWIGAALPAGTGSRTVLAGGAALLAGAADLLFPGRLPSARRQVDEDWLVRYRGWVYGLGYWVQLGLGVTTIVTTATVYAWLAACVGTGSALAGAVGGAVFGAARALPLLAVRRIDTPAGLRRLVGRFSGWAARARMGTAGACLVIGAGALWGRW